MDLSAWLHVVHSPFTTAICDVCSGHPAQPAFEAAIDKELQAAPQPKREALPLVSASNDELRSMSVKELKKILTDRKVSIAGLAEKQDLVDAVDKHCRSVTYYA